MSTLQFAAESIVFEKLSLYTGRFNIEHYKRLRAPLAANDDIRTKRLVMLAAAGCMKTVALQICIAHHIARIGGDCKFFAQNDDKGDTWSQDRGQPFILPIPECRRLLKMSITERGRVTKSKWYFRNCTFHISGPSKAQRQTDQLQTVWIDEAHLPDSFEDGALKEIEDRIQSAGWLGKAVYGTTAPDDGREIAQFFLAGPQNEYHWKCPKCAKLIWPLWREVTPTQKHAVEVYGKDVFLWDETPDKKPIVESIRARCPHCEAIFHDTTQDRESLCGDDYVPMNPNPQPGTDSYRWNVFSVPELEWKSTLQKYVEAIEYALLGNLDVMENFVKKQICGIWTPTMPSFGDAKGNRDYKLGDSWGVNPCKRFLTSDPQAGKGGEPAHRHALVTEWTPQGDSRRVHYRRIDTAAQLHEMAAEFGVSEGVKRTAATPGRWPCVMVDSGHEPRRTFRECSEFQWLAFKGSDLQQFHTIRDKEGRALTTPMPYSDPEPQSGVVGESLPKRMRGVTRGHLPPGWAYVLTGHNPELDGYIYALLTGSSGRYFGVASNFDLLFPDTGDLRKGYCANMPAFMPKIVEDKNTRTTKKLIYVKIAHDHLHDMEKMALVLAIKHGYFPIAKMGESIKKDEP
jgi:hypothetical protein